MSLSARLTSQPRSALSSRAAGAHTRARLVATPSKDLRAHGPRACRVYAGAVQKVNAEELEQIIAERDRPLIIDFFATWCGPCLMLAKELEQVAADLGDGVRIVKVDTDEESDLASQLQIQGLPTIVFVPAAKDKPALRTEGLLPAETLKQIVREQLA